MTPATSSANNGGYALLDLVAALVVASLVAALVMPGAMALFSRAELEMKSSAVATLLRQDRNAALALGAPIYSVVDLERNIVRSGASSHVVQLPASMAAEIIPFNGESDDRVGGFVFQPTGQSSGGVLALVNDGRAKTIEVSRLNSAILLNDGATTEELR